MRGWLYLIKNGEIYKIGITKNLDSRMRQLKPDKIIAKLYCRDYVKLERELHNRYKKYRIPQTEYFRLNNYHLKEIRQRLSIPNHEINLILRIFLKSIFFILLAFILISILISFSINDIHILLLKTFLWMEWFSFGFSLLSLFFHSGKYLSFSNELKYRFSRFIFYILFGFIFRIVNFLYN